MKQISSPPQSNAEVIVNENFGALSWAFVYANRPDTTGALVWGYYGGRWGGYSVTQGTLTLTNSATNYVVVDRTNGAISVSTSATNWNNLALYARVYLLTTAGNIVTSVQDHRGGPGGIFGHIPVGSPPI